MQNEGVSSLIASYGALFSVDEYRDLVRMITSNEYQSEELN